MYYLLVSTSRNISRCSETPPHVRARGAGFYRGFCLRTERDLLRTGCRAAFRPLVEFFQPCRRIQLMSFRPLVGFTRPCRRVQFLYSVRWWISSDHAGGFSSGPFHPLVDFIRPRRRIQFGALPSVGGFHPTTPEVSADRNEAYPKVTATLGFVGTATRGTSVRWWNISRHAGESFVWIGR